MTQEELDQLMADTVIEDDKNSIDESLDEIGSESDEESDNQNVEDLQEESEAKEATEDMEELSSEEDLSYRADPTALTPPPVTEENSVVTQLDDVTRESEAKANEVFDKLDEVSLISNNILNASIEQKSVVEKNIEIFEKLSNKFEDIETFQTALKDNNILLQRVNEIEEESSKIDLMMTDIMNVMQYQDIHRQKIERVINVMRALSHYMQSLFDSNIDDKSRSTSAITIDDHNSVDEEELEALLESFAKK
jgi:hypothetical protein